MLSYFKANKKEEKTKFELDADNIPQHIAIIMDGNGRWAKAKNLPRTMGHKAGVETIRRDANEKIKALKKDGHISEDEVKKGEESVQKKTDQYVKEIDSLVVAKEKEIMSI